MRPHLPRKNKDFEPIVGSCSGSGTRCPVSTQLGGFPVSLVWLPEFSTESCAEAPKPSMNTTGSFGRFGVEPLADETCAPSIPLPSISQVTRRGKAETSNNPHKKWLFDWTFKGRRSKINEFQQWSCWTTPAKSQQLASHHLSEKLR